MKKICVFISGQGSTLLNIIESIECNKIQNAKISLVLSDRDNIKGLDIARSNNIKTVIINKKLESETFNNQINNTLDENNIDLIVMGGFLSLYKIPKRYYKKAINIHPSLIPKFCGKGFYGEKVHKAVLKNKEKISGCTVHYVNERYDEGEIICQKKVEILKSDTVESLSKKVKKVEFSVYPKVINSILNRI